MKKIILFLLLFVLIPMSVFSAGIVFPDGGGIKIPSYTNPYTEKQNDLLFFSKQYEISGKKENIYSFSFNTRVNDVFEWGIQQELYSQKNLKDPDPVISFKINISDYMYENVFVVGLLLNLDSDSWNSFYVMKDNIGFGFNFDGKNGKDSFFGGYDFLENKPDEFFMIFRHQFIFDDSFSLIAEFNGDAPSFTLSYDYSDEYSFYIGYEGEGDFAKSLLIDNDRIFIGVKGEY